MGPAWHPTKGVSKSGSTDREGPLHISVKVVGQREQTPLMILTPGRFIKGDAVLQISWTDHRAQTPGIIWAQPDP